MSPLVLAASAWDAFTFPEPYSMRPVLTKHQKVGSAQHVCKVLVGSGRTHFVETLSISPNAVCLSARAAAKFSSASAS